MLSSYTPARTPCIVVVDSRNVRGQSRKVFGHGRETQISGIRRALSDYGFDVKEVIVGVATRTSNSNPSPRLQEALAKNQDFAAALRQNGATVLEGNLVQRGRDDPEEKQVDVLCALAIADAADRIAKEKTRARCVIVLSEDMDLMPAIQFAVQRGVKAYAAAYDTVHFRPDQEDWILLHEQAMREICKPPGRRSGTKLREQLAKTITSSLPQQPVSWRVIAPQMSDGRALLSSNSGALGTWTPDRKLARDEKVPLYAIGVEMDTHGGRFPYLTLSSSHPTAPPQDVELGDVLYWSEPTMLKVKLDSGSTASLRGLPGSLFPGDRVAVLTTTKGGDRARYLVGAVSYSDRPAAWTAASSTAVAVLDAAPSDGHAWMEARLEDSGGTVRIKTGWNSHLTAGARLVVALCGVDASGVPQAMPLCCCIA